MKNNGRRKIGEKGFYIALSSCIVVIAIVFYAGNMASKKNSDFSQDVADNVQVEEDGGFDEIISAVSTPAPAQTATPAPPVVTVKPKQAAPAAAATSSNVQARAQTPAPQATPAAEPSFIMPVNGNVIASFSDGELVYNKDLDDWRTHNGIDIKADLGTDVKAAADGKVIEFSDSVLGKYIIIEHDNGFKTMYANLQNEALVSVDQTVKKGDTIGKTGATSISEKFMDPHLHFEMYRDNKCINPLEWIQQ